MMEVCFRLTFYMFIAILIKYFGLLLSLERKWVRGRAGEVSVAKSGLFPRSFQHSLSQPTLSTHSTSYYFSQPTVPLTNPLNQLYPSFTFSTHFFSHSLNTSPYSLIPLLPSLILLNHSFLHLLS